MRKSFAILLFILLQVFSYSLSVYAQPSANGTYGPVTPTLMRALENAGGTIYCFDSLMTNSDGIGGSSTGITFRLFYEWQIPSDSIPANSRIDSVELSFFVENPYPGPPFYGLWDKFYTIDQDLQANNYPVLWNEDATHSDSIGFALGPNGPSSYTIDSTYHNGSLFCTAVANAVIANKLVLGMHDGYESLGYSNVIQNSSLKMKIFFTRPLVTDTITQWTSTGAAIDSIARWMTDHFQKYRVPQFFQFAVGTSEALQGMQKIDSGQKYNNWYNQQDVTNPQVFRITALARSFIADLFPTKLGIVIKTELIDNPSVGGNTLGFRDPWLIDYADPIYGKRNRGQSSAVWYDNLGPIFYPDSSHTYNSAKYNGVFLNQTIGTGKPYYSVRVPQSQTLGSYTGNFVEWTSDSAQIGNANADTTTIVFYRAVDTIRARYKGALIASTSSATGPNNQRKVVSYGGVEYAVYQSGGSIWYTQNSGSGWTKEVRIWPSSTARNPSIATTYNGQVDVHIVWEDNDYTFGYPLAWTWYCRSTDAGSTWGSYTSVGDFNNNGLGERYDATPVVGSGNTGTLAVVGWRYFGGIALLAEPALNSNHNYYAVPNTDSTSNHPSLDCESGYKLVYAHGTGKIFYQEFTVNPTTYQITPGTSTELTSGLSITGSANPTIATYSTTNVYVAWDAYNGTAHHVFARERNGSGWQSLVEFTDGTRSESQPIIGTDLYLGKVLLLWQSDTHIAKVSRDVTNPAWSNVSDRGVGATPNLTPSVQSGYQPLAAWTTGSAAPYTLNFPMLGAPSMQSYNAGVTTGNNQRKMARGSSGALYLVYDSEGDIWFTKSTNNGSSWSASRYLSGGLVNCTYPAITERNGYLYVAWQRNGTTYNVMYSFSTDSGATWLATPDTLKSGLTTGPTPSIMAGTPANSFELMIAYLTGSAINSSRTTSQTPAPSSWTSYTVTGTPGIGAQNPCLAYKTSSPSYSITWDNSGGGTTYYNDFTYYWGNATSVNGWLAGQGISNTINASYAINANGDKHVATEGTQSSWGVIIDTKNLSQTVYTEFYYSYYKSYYKPVITGLTGGRASLLWYRSDNTLWKTTYDGSGWSTPAGFGTNDKYPTVSIDNPPGNTAYAMWTNGTAAPYSIVIDANGGPLQKGLQDWTYSRRVALVTADLKTRVQVELSPPTFTLGDGSEMTLAYNPVDDGASYDAISAWSALETAPCILPTATQAVLYADCILSGLQTELIAMPTFTLQVVDAQSGAVLSQQPVQPPVSDTLATVESQLNIAVPIPAGKPVKFRIQPLLADKSIFTAAIAHVYRESGPKSPKIGAPLTNGTVRPTDYALFANYPNPFNPTTRISYNLPTDAYVILKVYDVIGREVAILVNGYQEAGYRSVEFNASNLPSGVYFYRLQSGEFMSTGKLVLIR